MSAGPFPQSWSAEVLASPPLISPARQFLYPLRVPGEEEAMQRGALQALIKPQHGGHFLAIFALGFTDPMLPTGLFPSPHADRLLALAGGYAYLLDTLSPERCTLLPLRPVVQLINAVQEELVLLAGFHAVLAIDAHGVRWQTARLSWEGIKLGEMRDGRLHGEGWDMISDREVPFVVDLATGSHTGGGFSR